MHICVIKQVECSCCCYTSSQILSAPIAIYTQFLTLSNIYLTILSNYDFPVAPRVGSWKIVQMELPYKAAVTLLLVWTCRIVERETLEPEIMGSIVACFSLSANTP